MSGPELEFLVIADYIAILNQKLYMMGGGWNRWQASSYPGQLQMGIAASVMVPWESVTDPFSVRFTFLDEDGNLVGPEGLAAQGQVGVPAGLTRGSSQRLLVGMNLSFPLPKPGRYEVRAQLGEDGPQRIVVFDAVLKGARG